MTKHARTRQYSDLLTADVNAKGVLDVDTVKGCTAGMRNRPRGCYDACYAASIARFRGLDFTRAVSRRVHSHAQAIEIESAVRAAPLGFFRVGTMGDPSHDWPLTVETIEWLAPYATPVVVTKHWRVASDEEISRLVDCGAVLHTSVSALDTSVELSHRMHEIARYAGSGGASFARIVSCAFNPDLAEGRRLAAIQDKIFELPLVIDNPLRIPRTHYLVASGLVRVEDVKDLNSTRPISLANRGSYLGHCAQCPDVCGIAASTVARPAPPQREFDFT